MILMLINEWRAEKMSDFNYTSFAMEEQDTHHIIT